MDDETTGVVNYILIVRKAPLLLGGCLLFSWLAIRCYNEWASLVELQEGEND